MNILFFWPIFGLMSIAGAHGTGHHEKKHLGHVHFIERHHHLYRDEEKKPPVVNTQAISDYDGLNLMFNSVEGLFGFANVSESVAFAFLKRPTGSVIFLLNSKTGTLVRYQTLEKISLIKTKELKCDVLHAFRHLLVKYELQNETASGETTEIKPSSEDGLELLANVYLHLGHPQEKGDTRFRSFKFLSKLTKKLNGWYFGTLNGLVDGKGALPLKQNLNRFMSISLGLSKMFERAVGGLKTILKKVKFDLNPIYNGKNGAEVFVYILRQTGSKFDLGALWSKLLNDTGELLKILGLLGGGETKNGVDETFAMVAYLWEYTNGRISLPDLVKFLLEASSEENWSKSDDGDYSNVIKDLKNITDEQSRKYDNGQLSPFVLFTTNLTANSLIKNGVNISDIVQKWRKRDWIGGLKFVTEITAKLSSPDAYSSIIFDSFTAFLNTTSDPKALKRLVPGFSVENLTSGGNLWESINKQYDIDQQLTKNKDANEVLNRVPGYADISGYYKKTFGKSLNYSQILGGSTLAKYVGKFSKTITGPTKWTYDIIKDSLHDSGSFIKHIFWDPWKPFIPGIGPKIPDPSKIPIKPAPPKDPEAAEAEEPDVTTKKKEIEIATKSDGEIVTKIKDEEPTKQPEETVVKKDDDGKIEVEKDDEPPKKIEDLIVTKPDDETATKKIEGETVTKLKDEEDETTTKKKEDCDECDKKAAKDEDAEKKKDGETCGDCDGEKSKKDEEKKDEEKKDEEKKDELKKVEEELEKAKKEEATTEKGCGDCAKKIDEEKVVQTPEGANLIPIEYKRHHNVKHYGHHNRKYNNHENKHQNKHHFKGHHHHQEKKHENPRKHAVHQNKHSNVGHQNKKHQEKKNYRHKNISHQDKKSNSLNSN